MRASILCLALLAFALPAGAQTGRWLDSFAVPGAFGGSAFGPVGVNAAVPDGAGALVAGSFRVVDDVTANGVARWTGTAWEAFGGGLLCQTCGFDGPEPGVGQAVVRAADGAVWVAGRFDAVVQPDGTVLGASGLARWTGAAWDIPGRLVSGSVYAPVGYALVAQGASVVVAGDFSTLRRPNGTSITGFVARWTAGAWESLSTGGTTYALAVLPDGRLVAPGYVATPDGNGAVAIVVRNGAAWQPLTDPIDGTFSYVRSLAVDGSGLVVGGGFAGGRTATGTLVRSQNVIRWDGAAWQPLGLGVAGTEARVVSPDGAGGLLVGGGVSGGIGADGSVVSSPGLVRWTGTAWAPRSVGGEVQAIARLGAEALLGGTFSVLDGTGDATVRAQNLAVLPDGGGVRPLSARTGRDGLSVYPAALAADGCGGLHVPGERNGPQPGGAVRTWSGTAWKPVPAGLMASFTRRPDAFNEVEALAAVPGSCSTFVVGGSFAGVTPASGPAIVSANVVLWNGTAWQPLGLGTDGDVRAVAVHDDGRIVVGGLFATVFQADGTPIEARNVAEWTPGSGWQSFGRGVVPGAGAFGYPISDLVTSADGSVFVVGTFAAVAGSDGAERPARSVARWTGAAWDTFGGIQSRPFGVSAGIATSAVTWQGSLVVAGLFTEVEQPSGAILDAQGIAAYDGQTWRALPGLDFSPRDLVVAGDELFASGGLLGAPARRTGDVWTPLDLLGTTGVGVAAASGRTLYFGGADIAGGTGSPGLADFDLDGIVGAEPPPTEARTRGLAAFPNPARGATTLRFTAEGPARLVLLDVLGRTAAVVRDAEARTGEQSASVDTSRLPAGVYVARLDAGGETQTVRITVVR